MKELRDMKSTEKNIQTGRHVSDFFQVLNSSDPTVLAITCSNRDLVVSIIEISNRFTEKIYYKVLKSFDHRNLTSVFEAQMKCRNNDF